MFVFEKESEVLLSAEERVSLQPIACGDVLQQRGVSSWLGGKEVVVSRQGGVISCGVWSHR